MKGALLLCLAACIVLRAHSMVVETLYIPVPCSKLDHFLTVDNDVWTNYLATIPVFRGKQVWVAADQNAVNQQNCSAWSVIHWESRSGWKAINKTTLTRVLAEFTAAYGSNLPVHPFPTSGNGYNLISNATVQEPSISSAVGFTEYTVPCLQLHKFTSLLQSVWAPYLASIFVFQKLEVWVNPAQQIGMCNAWTVTHWESRAVWQALYEGPSWIRNWARVVAALGTDPHPMPQPNGQGYNIARYRSSVRTPRVP